VVAAWEMRSDLLASAFVHLPEFPGSSKSERAARSEKQLFDRATREVSWSHPRFPPRSTLTRVCVMLATGG